MTSMIENVQTVLVQEPKVDGNGKKYFSEIQFKERKKLNLVPIGWNEDGHLILGKTVYINNSHGT